MSRLEEKRKERLRNGGGRRGSGGKKRAKQPSQNLGLTPQNERELSEIGPFRTETEERDCLFCPLKFKISVKTGPIWGIFAFWEGSKRQGQTRRFNSWNGKTRKERKGLYLFASLSSRGVWGVSTPSLSCPAIFLKEAFIVKERIARTTGAMLLKIFFVFEVRSTQGKGKIFTTMITNPVVLFF